MIPAIATDPIELDVVNGVAVTIPHGLGREPYGWLVLWAAADVRFYLQDPSADARTSLVLVPVGSGKVRLVLL